MKLKHRHISHAAAFWIILPLSACVTLLASLTLGMTSSTSGTHNLQQKSAGMILMYVFVSTALLTAFSIWGRSSETRRSLMLLLLAFVPLWGLPLILALFAWGWRMIK